MELVSVLRILWRFRLLVVVSAALALLAGYSMAYRFGIPPKFESRQYDVGLGSVTALVDTPSSQVVDLGGGTGADIQTLAARSTLLASLITSSPLKDEIARRAGIAGNKLIAIPPSAGGVGAIGSGDVSGASVRLTDPAANILRATVPTPESGEVPIIAVQSQAPTAAVAARLANASIVVLKEHLKSVAGVDRVPDARRLVVTQLGPAESAVATRGTKPIMAIVIAILVFGFGCVTILGAQALIGGWRRAALMELLPQDVELDFVEGDDSSPFDEEDQAPERLPERARPGPDDEPDEVVAPRQTDAVGSQ